MNQPEVDEARADESDAVSAPGAPSRRSRGVVAMRALMAVVLVTFGVVAGTLWTRTRDLEREVATIQRDARARPTGVTGPAAGDSATTVDLTKFKTCVNDYMRTVGVWSANVGSSYQYKFCK